MNNNVSYRSYNTITKMRMVKNAIKTYCTFRNILDQTTDLAHNAVAQ
jgi:hypothetical protein